MPLVNAYLIALVTLNGTSSVVRATPMAFITQHNKCTNTILNAIVHIASLQCEQVLRGFGKLKVGLSIKSLKDFVLKPHCQGRGGGELIIIIQRPCMIFTSGWDLSIISALRLGTLLRVNVLHTSLAIERWRLTAAYSYSHAWVTCIKIEA